MVWEQAGPYAPRPPLSWDDWYREHAMRVTLVVEAALAQGRGEDRDLAGAIRQLSHWTEKARERFE